jgi:hypothetical protein
MFCLHMLIPFPSPLGQSMAYWDGKCDFAAAPKARISGNLQECQYLLQLLPIERTNRTSI